MAFDATGFIQFGHGAGTTGLFHYKTNDLFTAVDDADYFLGAYSKLTLGDVILVSSDLDGTPLYNSLVVTAATSSTVTTTPNTSSTITITSRENVTCDFAAVGTAETKYLVYPRAATITKVLGVSSVNGAGSGGTSTVTITVPTTGAIATLPFLQDYVAGTAIEDTTITAHSLAAGAVITVATDGTGSHTGNAVVTLEFTPA